MGLASATAWSVGPEHHQRPDRESSAWSSTGDCEHGSTAGGCSHTGSGSVDRILKPIEYRIAGHTHRRDVFRLESLHTFSAIDECHGALRNDAQTVHKTESVSETATDISAQISR